MIKTKQYNLPKKYLSYSQLDLWRKSKDQYRERYYYEDGIPFENAETIFGKKIAKMLEDGIRHPVLDKIPKYKFSEYKIQIDVGGVPFFGVMDSFSKHFKRILEYKTGKQAWDIVRVRKHDQLVVYSLLTKLKFGKVDPLVRLVWMETAYKKGIDTIGSVTCEAETNELELTGKIKVFGRKVAEWERKNMVKIIQQTAQEISDDYTNFLKTR